MTTEMLDCCAPGRVKILIQVPIHVGRLIRFIGWASVKSSIGIMQRYVKG